MKSPSRFILAVFVIFVALSLALMGTTVTFAGEKSFRGVLDEGELNYYASCWSGWPADGCQPVKKYSGRIWEGSGNIEGIGKATVEVSACWDWGRGHVAPNEMYTADHYGALIVTTPQGFVDNKDDTEGDGAFTANATVTITDNKDDTITGEITGGSVYELIVHPGSSCGSINEWLISFEIVSGTGKYEGATGTGVYRMVWDSDKTSTNVSCSGTDYGDGGLSSPDRFLEQEISVHLD